MDRTELMSALKAEIELLETKLQELRVQINLAEKETKQRLEPELKRLEDEFHSRRDELQRLSEISRDALGEARKGMETAFKDMHEGFSRAFDILSRK